jgi:guanidinopropionase
MDSLKRMEDFFARVRAAGIVPLTAGGDHLCTLPILRALAKGRPLGMIHFDSHTDLFHSYFNGSLYTHGTPFRRAVEEGLLDPARVCMIGIRGTAYDSEDRDFARSVGIRVIPIEEFHARGSADVMAEARAIAGSGPTYVSYDIDFIDPAYAPGTGTPEVGGPTSWQALEVVRMLEGVQIVGADLVEVSPPFDPSGGTAYLGVSVMFELLCMIARVLRP